MAMKPRPRNFRDRPSRSASSSTTTGPLFGLGAHAHESGRRTRSASGSTFGDLKAGESEYGRDVSPEEVEGVYIISVAARILEMHPQTLRKYERVGLVTPSRTIGMLRLYSEEDIARLKLIKHLVGDLGLNLAGVQLVLEVFNHLLRVRARVNAVEARELRPFLAESLEETFELLHAHVRSSAT